MKYLGQDELTQGMGIGYLGEVRQGPDGGPYQWVQGVDGLGNPIGFWKKLRRVVRRALPLVERVASFIPHPAAQAVATGARMVRQSGLVGASGLGALYQAPDGTVYELQGLAEDELTQVMGIGALGEVRQGPDGGPYQWVQGVDGLGNPIGFWKKLRQVVRRALPLVERVASFIPHPAAQAVATGARMVRQSGLVGASGLGALYQAPDGSLHQVEGLGEAEEELRGLAEDEDVHGFAQEEEELRGLGQGYVREEGASGLEAYVPDQPAGTRWFTPPAQTPEMWKPLW